MICIYEAECKDFSNNGIGLLLPQSCTVTETLNGEYELTLVHPLDSDGRWMRLAEGRILRVPVPASMTPQMKLIQLSAGTPIYCVSTSGSKVRLHSEPSSDGKSLKKYRNKTEVILLSKSNEDWYEVTTPDGKRGYMEAKYLTYVRTDPTTDTATNEVVEQAQLRDQPFRIYRVVPDLEKVTVYARHIFYDLMENMVQQYKATNTDTGARVMQTLSEKCLSKHDFTFYSDLESTADGFVLENVNPAESILGDDGIASAYGGELARDWFDVYLVQRVGSDTGVQIREKKNLTGITYDLDVSNVVTRIMPTGEDVDGELLYLPELYVDSPKINDYPAPKWIHLEVSDAKEVKSGDDKKTKEQCYEEMRKAAQDEFDEGCDLPTITLKVDLVNCADTEEYKQYAALSNIFIGDSVRVMAPRIGVEVSMRMTQYTYDCLTRKYTAVTLGTVAEALEGNTITSRQIPTGSITGAKLVNGAVGSSKLAVNSIQTRHIAAEVITAEKIVAGAITADKIQAGAVTADKIQAGAITADKIKANSITGDKIAANTITAINIAGKTITADQLIAGLITADCGLIATGAIQTAQIADGSITAAKIVSLDADVITSGTIKADRLLIAGDDGLIYKINATSAGLTASQLTEEQYKNQINGTVIVANSITAAQIAAETITGNKIAANTITAANINVSSLFASEAFISLLRTSRIVDDKSIEMIVGDVEQNAEDIIASRSFSGDTPPTGNLPEGKIWVDTSENPSVIRRWLGLDVTTDAEYSGSGNGKAVETPNGTTAFDQIQQNLAANQNGSGDPTPDNIRWINPGRAKAILTRAGENLIGFDDGTKVSNGVSCVFSDHKISASGACTESWVDLTDHAKVGIQKNKAYTVTFDKAIGYTAVLRLAASSTAELNGYQDVYIYAGDTHASFTADADYSYARIYIGTTTGAEISISDLNVSLTAGSEARNIAYSGESFTLDLGQTVASGTLEWTTGKLVIDKKMLQLDGVTSKVILSSTISKGNIFRVDIPGIKHAESASAVGEVACSHYIATTGNKLYSGTQGVSVSAASDFIQIFDTTRSGMTADEYNSYLAAQYAAGTPVQILYALAEPEEVQLSVLDIRPISGEVNTLSVADGTLTVNYTASGWETVSSLEELNNGLNEALRIANAAVSQEEFQRIVRTDAEGLHVGDNLTDYEVLIDSASVNVVASGKKVSSFSTNFIRLDNMQIRKVRGGLAISVYNG